MGLKFGFLYKGETQIESVWEQDAKESVWIQKG